MHTLTKAGITVPLSALAPGSADPLLRARPEAQHLRALLAAARADLDLADSEAELCGASVCVVNGGVLAAQVRRGATGEEDGGMGVWVDWWKRLAGMGSTFAVGPTPQTTTGQVEWYDEAMLQPVKASPDHYARPWYDSVAVGVEDANGGRRMEYAQLRIIFRWAGGWAGDGRRMGRGWAGDGRA
jgi:hypothetical protein